MNRKQIKQFVKDYSFPVKVFDQKLFDYYVNQLSGYYDFRTHLIALETFLSAGEEDVDVMWNAIKEDAVQSIRDSAEWKEFMESRLPGCNLAGQRDQSRYLEYPKGDIFIPENDQHWIVSADIKQANFNVVNWRCPEIFHGNTYEEWLSRFTSYQYFLQSKYLRQVIFGSLNAKRIQALQKYLIDEFALKVREKTGHEPITGTADEVQYRFSDPKSAFAFAIEIESIVSPVKMQVSAFYLRRLLETSCYVQMIWESSLPVKDDVPFEIKNTPSYLFMQAFKFVTGGTLTQEDMVFEYEKQLAYFAEPFFSQDKV